MKLLKTIFFIKLNDVFETVYLCCRDVSGGCGGVEMGHALKLQHVVTFSHCEK